MDPFSKWVEAYPARNNIAATIARLLLEQIFSRFGLSEIIDSDQRPHFVGDLLKNICLALNIKQRFHIAGHPQSSRLVKCTNRTIKTALRKIIVSFSKKLVQKAAFCINGN
ncbi:unnamed protein product [Lepidochelys kempii]